MFISVSRARSVPLLIECSTMRLRGGAKSLRITLMEDNVCQASLISPTSTDIACDDVK